MRGWWMFAYVAFVALIIATVLAAFAGRVRAEDPAASAAGRALGTAHERTEMATRRVVIERQRPEGARASTGRFTKPHRVVIPR